MIDDDGHLSSSKTPPGAGQREPGAPLSSGMEFAGVGLQFGFAIMLFTFVGYWLDKRFGTSPWLLIMCVFVGAGAAFYHLYERVIGRPGSRGRQGS